MFQEGGTFLNILIIQIKYIGNVYHKTDVAISRVLLVLVDNVINTQSILSNEQIVMVETISMSC